ncbi:MAG: site-specific integrase [Planctomycetes bacterium]|nr:site-specific integrase [Planctomycetota bacterium]
MKLYKPIYTDKSGNKKKCQSWYIGFTDNQNKRRRLPAFSNKRASERAAEKIEELLSSGGVLSPDLQRWIENTSGKMRKSLVKFGLIDNRRISNHIGKSLIKHLSDFHNGLLAKGNGEPYVKQTTSLIKSIFKGCGFETYSDIDANEVYTFLADMRSDEGTGQRTFNYGLKAVKQFAKWMIKERRATENPLEHLTCVTQTEKRRQRRALSIQEQIKLLEIAENGRKHHNLTGHERYLVYKLALQTGLRANEIRNLTASSFDFNNRTVTVTGAYTKNKKLAVLDLKRDTTLELKSFLSHKMPGVKVFAVPNQPAKMIKSDLKEAGIEYKTEEGQADFHSLRHSFITNLAKAGVHPSDAMVLARHSTITLTMDYYTHVKRESLQGIIDAQPDLTISKQNKKVG